MNKLRGYIKLLEGDERLTCLRQGTLSPDDITYVDGLPVQVHPYVKFEVQVTVQPMSGRDLFMMPEAFRDKTTLAMWQAHRTPKQDVVRVELMDIVLWRGRAYQVQAAEDWESYTKATLCGIDLGAYAGTVDVDNLPVLYPNPPIVTPDPGPAPDPSPTPDPDPTPNPNPNPTPEPDPTPNPGPVITPTPAPAGDEELDMDVGPYALTTFFNPGETKDFQNPGDGTTPMRYRMPRSGRVTGYTITGTANRSPYGAYLTVRDAMTGETSVAVFVDPETQRGFNVDEGVQVIFSSPVPVARGQVLSLKLKIKDGNFGSVDLAAFLQVILDPAT